MPLVADAELAYRYGAPSVFRRADAGAELLLATSGGVTEAGPTLRPYFFSPADRCTCPWWGKHRGTRGPCKHVLAARMAVRDEVR